MKKKKESEPCYVIKIPIVDRPYIRDALGELFEIVRNLWNDCVAEVNNRLDYLMTIPEFRENSIKIAELRKKQCVYEKDTEEYKKYAEELKPYYMLQNKYRKEQDLTSDFKKLQTNFVLPLIKKNYDKYSCICSAFYAGISKDLGRSLDKLFYGNGKQIHFKKRYPGITCLQGSRTRSERFNNFAGVSLFFDKLNNLFYIEVTNVKAINKKTGKFENIKIPLSLIQKGYDRGRIQYLLKNLNYACDLSIVPKTREELKYFYEELFYKMKENGYENKMLFRKIGNLNVIREKIRGVDRYFLSITITGKPFPKYSLNSIKEVHTNVVGIDLGTQTIALSFRNKEGNVFKTDLFELVEEIDNDYMKRLAEIDKKMELSRRVNNPNNFKENGEIKEGRHTWENSQNYFDLKNKNKTLNRTKTVITKVSHNQLVKYILNYAHNVVIEPMDFTALAKRAKETTYHTKVVDGEEVKVANKKARYGKSVLKKSPASFVTTLKNAIKEVDGQFIEADKFNTKASQYNHQTDTYVKKDRSVRWNDNLYYMGEEVNIQRDLYSAFLLSNMNFETKKIDKEMCEIGFDDFVLLHNDCLKNLNSSQSQALKNIL